MSYQVLARKWRPRIFNELVGQEHVVRALVNALDHDRIHHAYLFTGTRGVGKTTIARILAKSLNCERGVGSTPCGECSSCLEIDEGRFVDLIEVDAASRTKVEDTRELLDNVQYAPTRGRYKVYLIDEVHMLSTHSFNALLKTLEEPPPHIKFLLATTDPQRLPVTILSRCLQFNLKRLPMTLISGHLGHILDQEHIAYETPALTHIARAADGSMRDALSLLDQAIAYGNGKLSTEDVSVMLGSIEQDHVYKLFEALTGQDGSKLLACIHDLSELTPDFSDVLGELINLLHRIAVAQVVPSFQYEDVDNEVIARFATRVSPEDMQLYYQIALLGRRDLELAPDPRSGFEMIMLRMLAFRPVAVSGDPTNKDISAMKSPASMKSASAAGEISHSNNTAGDHDWSSIVNELKVTGMVRELAANCELVKFDDKRVELLLDNAHQHLRSKNCEKRLEQSLQQYFANPVKLDIRVGMGASETPALQRSRNEQERYQAALKAIENDANVKTLRDTFDARVLPDTIQPLD